MKCKNLLNGKDKDAFMISNPIGFHDVDLGSPLDLTATNTTSDPRDDPVDLVGLRQEEDKYDRDSDDDVYDNANREKEEMTQMRLTTEQNESENQLASMNYNTNGMTTPSTDVDRSRRCMNYLNDPSMKKITQINMGEIPLEPMGLSLSGSGLQLFVKLNPELRKVLGSDVGAKQTKKRRKATTKITKKDERAIFDESPKKDTSELFNKPRYLKDTSQADSVHNETLPFNDHFKETSARGRPKYPSYKHDNLQNMIYPRPPDQQFVTVQPPPRRDYPMEYSNTVVESATRNDCLAMPKPAYRNRYRPGTMAKDATCSVPQWNDEEISNTKPIVAPDVKEIGLSRNEPHLKPNQASTSHEWLSTRFKSSNLPLRKPRSKLSRRLHSPEGSNHKTSRHCRHCIHPRHYPSHSILYSSNEDDDDYNDSHGYDDSDNDRMIKLHPRKKEKLDERAQRSRANDILRYGDDTPWRGTNDYAPEMNKSEQSNAESSIGPSFDITQLSPQAMDSETLSKFTEYTQDMRKDLKRRYKDLSQLLRDFNENVKEKNGKSSTETEIETANDKRELDKRCIVM